ncbi:MAG: hypothetical protein WAO21_00525 [Verrucomicrobiia bacterium]|jgi:predicted transcriptional regulator
MKTALLEHIEAKVINYLLDTNAPNLVSRIAFQIQETREDTLQAVQSLVKSGTIKGMQDLTLFTSTGETVAYTLAYALQVPVPFIHPPPVTPHIRRSSRLGR